MDKHTAEKWLDVIENVLGGLPTGLMYAPTDDYMSYAEQEFNLTFDNLIKFKNIKKLIRTNLFDPGNEPRSAGPSELSTASGIKLKHNGNGEVEDVPILGWEVILGEPGSSDYFVVVYTDGIVATDEIGLLDYVGRL